MPPEGEAGPPLIEADHPPRGTPTTDAAPDEASPSGRRRLSRRPHGPRSAARETAVIVLLAVAIAVVVKTFVAQVFWIPSGSMLPQLQIGDRVVVSRLAYRLHAPHRGDIIVFRAPPSQQPPRPPPAPLPVRILRDVGEELGVVAPSTEDYVKRVIGLPGDTVEARGGHVYIDGRLLREPYLPPGDTTSNFGPVVVPPHRLWVLGDNRGDSCDSRCFPEGAIPESSVIGRVVFRIWPLSHTAFL